MLKRLQRIAAEYVPSDDFNTYIAHVTWGPAMTAAITGAGGAYDETLQQSVRSAGLRLAWPTKVYGKVKDTGCVVVFSTPVDIVRAKHVFDFELGETITVQEVVQVPL